MAIDTKDKRASFFSHGGRYWMGKAYDPNGAIDAAHRLFSLTVYSGNTVALTVQAGRNTIAGTISQVVGAGDKIRITAKRTKGSNTLITLGDGSSIRVTWKRS